MRVSEMFDLTGKAAIVTGASSGIGALIARALAEAGADVVLAARRKERLEQVADGLKSLKRRTLVVPTDVTDPAAVDALVTDTVARFGKVDILVNSAGTSRSFPAEEEKLRHYQLVLSVDLVGAFICSQRAGREMLARRYGRIINIASVYGTVASGPERPMAGYVSAKHGLVGLTKEMAYQWARRGVTVNAIGPSYISTELTADFIASQRQAILRDTPMGRLCEEDDLRGVVVFLASEAARFITGQTIYVDGGWTIA